MSAPTIDNTQLAFIGATIAMMQDELPEEEKEVMNGLRDSWAHTAPEIAYLFWKKIHRFCCSVLTDTGPDGRHLRCCEVYNTRYKEFVATWYNDKSD
jgi:hypothetical protein